MPINIHPISKTGNISKYLRVDTGYRKWRRTFCACVDHQILTPFVKRWQRLPSKGYNPIWPRMIEINIYDDTLVEMNYSDEESVYTEAINYALDLAEETLSGIIEDEDLFDAIFDKKFNKYYPNIVHDDIKTLCAGVIYNIKEKIAFNKAFLKAENYFERELPKKELMLEYLSGKKITSAVEFT